MDSLRGTLPASAIALERVPPARPGTFDDTDTATRKTVVKMCELIRKSCRDPYVQRCAQYAKQHFSMGSNDPAALAWGVFWYVKHSVKFRLDEGTMFQIGERDQQDLLIAPEVLVRMKDPAEDCDGFTMLTAALLTCLGVPVLIATVATEADDPSRWSHVFLCAIVNGGVMPLDTSHGPAPGWMVPKHRIHRWQTWKLDGTPADVKIPSYQGLHGYSATRRGGLGQVRVGGRLVMMPRIVTKRGRGFGQAGCATATCDQYADDGVTCLEYDDSSCTGSTSVDCSSFALTAAQAAACGITSPAQTTGDTPQLACADSGGTWNGTGCVPSGNPNPCPAGQTWNGFSCSGGGTPNYAALAQSVVGAVGQDVRAVIQQPQALLQAQTWANLVNYLPIIGIPVLRVVS